MESEMLRLERTGDENVAATQSLCAAANAAGAAISQRLCAAGLEGEEVRLRGRGLTAYPNRLVVGDFYDKPGETRREEIFAASGNCSREGALWMAEAIDNGLLDNLSEQVEEMARAAREAEASIRALDQVV